VKSSIAPAAKRFNQKSPAAIAQPERASDQESQVLTNVRMESTTSIGTQS
jgi:hypothetical protein